MGYVFISYSKQNRADARKLVQHLLDHGFDVWIDDRINFGKRWLDVIFAALDKADAVIVLMTPESAASEWVQKEYQYAHELKKPLFPMLLSGERFPFFVNVQYEDITGERLPSAQFLTDLEAVIGRRSTSGADVTPQPPDGTPAEGTLDTTPFPRMQPGSRRLPLWIGGAAALLLLIGLGAIALSSGGNTPAPTMTISPTPPAVGLAPSETPAPFLPTDLPTLSSFEQLQTAQMQITNAAATQAAVGLTATQGAILNANATAAAEQIMATEAAAQATLLALSWTPTLRSTNTSTPTPQPTLTSLEAALTAARNFTGSNADWQALYPDGFEHVFADGVPMVLVPAGCFMMGSMEGDNTELPIHEQCFESPFWIDITEVTQDDFTRLGGVQNLTPRYLGSNRPVDSINWFEARDFCALRNAALPTETEWEYAARGPDSWEYPWGNTWISDYMVWHGTANEQTAIVRSRPLGRSWIGAFDLSGNVLEWTRSTEAPYPYVSTDGREAYMEGQTFVMRVLRGGGWNSDTPSDFRAAFRLPFGNDGGNNIIGFRCVKILQ